MAVTINTAAPSPKIADAAQLRGGLGELSGPPLDGDVNVVTRIEFAIRCTFLPLLAAASACSPSSPAPEAERASNGAPFLSSAGPASSAPQNPASSLSSSLAPLPPITTDAKPTPPPEPHWRAVPITVSSTLKDAFKKAGLDNDILDEVDRVFIERLDIFAHVRAGSTGTLLFDRDVLVGVVLQPGDRTQPLVALYARSPIDAPGFYDDEGFSLTGALLARPLALSVITSGFGARLDPLTGERGTHNGCDYAAPIGTPVLSIGDGVVVEKGHGGAAGRYLRIEYPPRHTALFMHLESFAPAIERGTRVIKGETVGAVGSTGRSTGPHLHFELHQGAVALDPKFIFPRPIAALRPEVLRRHHAKVADVIARHAALHP